MKRRVLGLAAFAALAIAVVGCGGGAGTPAAATLTAEGTEFAFGPAQWTVQAGQEVTVNFENAGSIEHNWVVLGAGVISTGLVAAGNEGSVTFSIAQAGEYTVICDVPGHREAGMVGTLVVE